MNTRTLPELTEEYILTHDLRPDTVKIYRAATKSYVNFFGECLACETTHREMLNWRRSELDRISKRSWNTYSSHLRTVYRYAMEHGLVDFKVNPLRETRVIPTKRPKKTIVNDAIVRARSWLEVLASEESETISRTEITPAWFWLSVFEMFYYTGLRLNALLCLRYVDIDLSQRMIKVRGETEKTHREFMIPVPDGLMPHLERIMTAARALDFLPKDQLFNVNRFSGHYRRKEMNSDQVEAMFKKVTAMTGVRITPHRFRHTIASELMRQPERNIHLTKTLLNHSNIATTMEYLEPDYDMMREVMNERGRRPAKIRYLSKADAAVRADNRPRLPTPLKSLISAPATQAPSNISPAAPQKTRSNQDAGSVSPKHTKIVPPISSHEPPKRDRSATQEPSQQNNLRCPAEYLAPSSHDDDLLQISGLPSDCSSPEELVRSLDQIAQWLRKNVTRENVPVRTLDQGPSQNLPDQMQHSRSNTFSDTGWSPRSG
ncbi:MAG TPA: site-specific integrase [Pseudomonas sp.]|uniref:site-specific integrase n=1 Tax=Pseudomonas sp. TaxID=306 RepID=UPI002EDA8EDC